MIRSQPVDYNIVLLGLLSTTDSLYDSLVNTLNLEGYSIEGRGRYEVYLFAASVIFVHIHSQLPELRHTAVSSIYYSNLRNHIDSRLSPIGSFQDYYPAKSAKSLFKARRESYMKVVLQLVRGEESIATVVNSLLDCVMESQSRDRIPLCYVDLFQRKIFLVNLNVAPRSCRASGCGMRIGERRREDC